MNRRSFLAAVAALPLVGHLLSLETPETPVRFVGATFWENGNHWIVRLHWQDAVPESIILRTPPSRRTIVELFRAAGTPQTRARILALLSIA